ncbi:ABC transporter permease [Propionibacteriaceae bacterium G1746]
MIETFIAGLIHGNSYALVAVGVSLVFGVANVVNFAHGSVFGFGAMLGWWFIAVLGWSFVPAVLAVVVATGILGLIINAVAVKPLSKAPPIAALLATFAVSMVLDNLSQIIFGPEVRAFPAVIPTNNLRIGGITFGTSDVVMLAVTLVVMVTLALFLRFGRYGRAIRATAQDPDAARQMGVPVGRVQALSFALASSLGGLAGVFVALYTSSVSPTSHVLTGMIAFVAATIGGLGSITGAVVAGFVLGIVEAYGVYWFGEGIRDLITFGALLVILVVRPYGLFGRKSAIATEPMTGTFFGGGHALRLGKKTLIALAVTAIVLIPALATAPFLAVAYQVVLMAIVAVPLTLLSGSAGQVSLGQVAPLAVGAYASALLSMQLNLPPLLAIPLAGLVSALLVTLLTLPIWRLGGHYISIATLGVGYVVVAIIRAAEPVTRGAYGLPGIPAPSLFGHTLTLPLEFYLLDLLFLLLALWVTMRIRKSHLGLTLNSVGADQVAARSLGVRARDYKALAYAVAAFFAGISGALMAHQNGYIDPSLFVIATSVLALTIIVLGGMNSPLGAVFGAVVLVGLPELLRVTPDVRILGYGLLLLLIVRFRPQGLFVRSDKRAKNDRDGDAGDGQAAATTSGPADPSPARADVTIDTNLEGARA